MPFNVTSVHTSTTQEEDLGHVVYKGESTQEKKNPQIILSYLKSKTENESF